MAAALIGGEFAVTGTAQSLTALLGLVDTVYFNALALRANPANVGTIYVGKTNVTVGANRFVILRPNEAFTIDVNVGYCSTNQWYCIATNPGDLIHAAGVA